MSNFDQLVNALDMSDLPSLPSISPHDMLVFDGFSFGSFPISPDVMTLPDIVNLLTPIEVPLHVQKKPRFNHVIDLTMDLQSEEEDFQDDGEGDVGIAYEETLVETEVDEDASIQSTLADDGKEESQIWDVAGKETWRKGERWRK